jgi:ribosomal-protein-alanine N-acetyltransferase
MRWWDIEPAMELERLLFDDAWTAPMFWSELAGVPETRWYVVAELDGRLVGYAGLFATRHEADVQTVAVSPDAQGHGVGTRLLRALIDEADRRDVGTVLLEVRADNETAIRLYERHDFTRISVRRGYYRPGPDGGSAVDAVVMRRRGGALGSGA